MSCPTLFVVRFVGRPNAANEVFLTLTAALERIANIPPESPVDLLELSERGESLLATSRGPVLQIA